MLNVLVCDEYLEPTYDLCQRNCPVIDPVFKGLGIINKDDEVFVLALIVNLGLSGVSSRHDGL